MAEARKKQQEAKELLKQIGEQLVAGESCPDENSIVKLLKVKENNQRQWL